MVRKAISIWSAIVNAHFFNIRPVLSFLSLFRKSYSDYKHELAAIAKLSDEKKGEIKSNTIPYGGENESDYEILSQKYEIWKSTLPGRDVPTEIVWHEKSNSLGAARKFREDHVGAEIAITNFANAVRVGGADSTGGKGSQEESLFRNTCLRVSLEEVEKKADPKIRSETGRYLPYYAAVVSKQVPSIGNEEESFGYISVSAPDLRRGVRSEGNYYARQKDSDLVKEVLYRKLSIAMMSAAIEGFTVLELGAFGCGAFGNKPGVVANVINDLINEPRFRGVFSHLI